MRLIKECLLNVCRVLMIQLYEINSKKPAPEKQRLQAHTKGFFSPTPVTTLPRNIFVSSIVVTTTVPHFDLKESSLGEGSMGFLALLLVIYFTSDFTVLTVLSHLWKWDNGEKSRMQD